MSASSTRTAVAEAQPQFVDVYRVGLLRRHDDRVRRRVDRDSGHTIGLDDALGLAELGVRVPDLHDVETVGVLEPAGERRPVRRRIVGDGQHEPDRVGVGEEPRAAEHGVDFTR